MAALAQGSSALSPGLMGAVLPFFYPLISIKKGIITFNRNGELQWF